MSSSRLHQWVQGAAVVAVAVPTFGIAFLVWREVALESGGASLNRMFHLILGAALVLLFADFFTVIRRCGGVGIALALGLGGFIACLAGAVLSEILGPPALALLLLGAVGWAIVLARASSAVPA